MKTIEITLYEYHELNETAKKSVREWYQEGMCFDPDLDFYVSELAEAGFVNAVIYYNVSGSQGDGACFTADIDESTFFVGKYAPLINADISLSIVNNGSIYFHSNTKKIQIKAHNLTTKEKYLIDELIKEIEDLRINWCNSLYDSFVDEFVYNRTNEYLDEALTGSHFWFRENGKVWHEG